MKTLTLLFFTSFIILITLFTTSCVECNKQPVQTSKPEPEKIYRTENGLFVADGFKESTQVYWKSPRGFIIVYESGMKYLIDYSNRSFLLNVTKDSLEIVALKRQALKDSLQIEVSKKYLRQ